MPPTRKTVDTTQNTNDVRENNIKSRLRSSKNNGLNVAPENGRRKSPRDPSCASPPAKRTAKIPEAQNRKEVPDNGRRMTRNAVENHESAEALPPILPGRGNRLQRETARGEEAGTSLDIRELSSEAEHPVTTSTQNERRSTRRGALPENHVLPTEAIISIESLENIRGTNELRSNDVQVSFPGVGGRETAEEEAASSDNVLEAAQPPATPRQIGQGAYGVVILVKDPVTGQELACKIVKDVFLSNRKSRAACREIMYLSVMDHENVISLVKIEAPSERDFQDLKFFMPRMETDLRKLIHEEEKMRKRRVQAFLYQIVRGLAYIHSAGIIHRDIKSNNMLVNPGTGLLKICDFGMARLWDEKEKPEMTLAINNRYNRAPEVIMGNKRYTPSVDVWSVGCIFYEMLMKGLPFFQGRNELEMLNKIVEMIGTPPPEVLGEARYATRVILRRTHPSTRGKKDDVLSRWEGHPIMGEVSDLLFKMISYAPNRISIEDALKHDFLRGGCSNFHLYICSCCDRLPSGMICRYGTMTPTFSSSEPPVPSSFEARLDRETPDEHKVRLRKMIAEVNEQIKRKNSQASSSRVSQ